MRQGKMQPLNVPLLQRPAVMTEDLLREREELLQLTGATAPHTSPMSYAGLTDP